MQDIVYSGLVKTLGVKGVVELTWNKKYHLPYKAYPKNLGYVKNSFLKSFHITKSNYDLVILAATKVDSFKNYINIAPEISSKVPVIWIDGGDRPEIGGDLDRLGEPTLLNEAKTIRDFDLIFKREMKLGNDFDANVIPLTFGFNQSRLPKKKSSSSKYDVAFWAGESHPIRSKALSLLENEFDCNSNGTTKGLSFNDFNRKGAFYLEELSSCKINISLRGGGFDTLRYWEIPAVGSLLLSEPADIHIENDFVHDKSAVFCDPSVDDIIDLCKYYLKETDKRERIVRNGKEHLIKYHTDIVRAQFILDKAKRLIGE
ncbi:MAG: hypothetical protein ACJATI_002147 [Halioglobus sp.]|jgi:hypothetical protein